MHRLIALLGAASLTAAVGAGTSVAKAGIWSSPATLSTCPALEAPEVLFPSESPSQASGPGAVIWRASSACAGGEGARLARLETSGVPGVESIPSTAAGKRIVLSGPIAASAAPHGQLLIASTRSSRAGVGQLAQGRAGGPFSPLGSVASPFSLARAYLGDVAIASPGASGRLGLRIERYFAQRLAPRAMPGTPATSATPRALSLALDFRSDALAVWVQGGALLARWLPASGGERPLQRLASTSGSVHVASLLSDNNRAIVAWAEERGATTRVYLARSGPGVRFGAPKLLEQFDGSAPRPGASPRLVRLSSESVMIAWSAFSQGRWLIRTAAIDLLGIGTATTIAAPSGDALLDELAPGPAGDALLLWEQPQSTTPATQTLYAARGFDSYPDRTIFAAPEQVAQIAANSQPTVALDPASDRAVAVWRGPEERLQYAIRASPTTR